MSPTSKKGDTKAGSVAGGQPSLPPGGRALLSALDDVGAGPNGRVGACPGQVVAPDGTVRTTACHWGRRTVMTRRLMIGLFELKFYRLNTNSIV
jgi:hypothetical protein